MLLSSNLPISNLPISNLPISNLPISNKKILVIWHSSIDKIRRTFDP